MTVIFDALDIQNDSMTVEVLSKGNHLVTIREGLDFTQAVFTWKQMRDLYSALHESLMETAHKVEQ